MQAIVPDELQALKEPNLFPAGIQFIKAKKAKATELMMMKFDLTNTKCVPGKKKRTSSARPASPPVLSSESCGRWAVIKNCLVPWCFKAIPNPVEKVHLNSTLLTQSDGIPTALLRKA